MNPITPFKDETIDVAPAEGEARVTFRTADGEIKSLDVKEWSIEEIQQLRNAAAELPQGKPFTAVVPFAGGKVTVDAHQCAFLNRKARRAFAAQFRKAAR